MNQKTLIGLVVAAVLAIVAAVLLNQAGRPRSEGVGAADDYLAPSLRDHVNDVTKVVVTAADDKVIATLARGTAGWTLAEKGGYAADTGKLRELLLKLADARLVEQKTATADKYAVLGVEDVSSKDAKGVQIEVDGLAKPLKVIVGIANSRGGGSFVRRAGDAQSWLASATLDVPKDAKDWLKRDLADIAATRISSVRIARPDGKSLRVFKSSETDPNFTVADLPKGREAGDPFSSNGLASTLGALRLDDVLPAKDTTPADNALKARYATFDGVVVDVVAWEQGGRDLAQFKATLDAAEADRHIAQAQASAKADFDTTSAAALAAGASKEPQAPGAAEAPIKPLSISDPAKDRDNRLAAIKQQVADLDARFDGWTFVLPAYKYAGINKSIEDLLKPVGGGKTLDGGKGAPARAAKPALKAPPPRR